MAATPAVELARRAARFPKEFQPVDGDVVGAVINYLNHLESSVNLWKGNVMKDINRRDLKEE